MNKDKVKLIILRECRPTLKEVQYLIGGYVEMIECREGFQLLMDEDGRCKKLPINHNASAMVGQTIVGNVVALFGAAQWVD